MWYVYLINNTQTTQINRDLRCWSAFNMAAWMRPMTVRPLQRILHSNCRFTFHVASIPCYVMRELPTWATSIVPKFHFASGFSCVPLGYVTIRIWIDRSKWERLKSLHVTFGVNEHCIQTEREHWPKQTRIVCAPNHLSISHQWALWRRFSVNWDEERTRKCHWFCVWTFNCTLILVELLCVRDGLSVCSQADSFIHRVNPKTPKFRFEKNKKREKKE